MVSQTVPFRALVIEDCESLSLARSRRRQPDRRRISLNWLSASVATALSSTVLFGSILHVGIGASASPVLASVGPLGTTRDAAEAARKSDRYRAVAARAAPKAVIQVSTIERIGDRDVIRLRPFSRVRARLGDDVAPEIAAAVPNFNPSTLLAGVDAPEKAAAPDPAIYGAELDGEVSVKFSDFPARGFAFTDAVTLSEKAVAMAVDEAAPFLADGEDAVANAPVADPTRFEVASAEPLPYAALQAAIVPENVSLVEKRDGDETDGLSSPAVDEKIVTIAPGSQLLSLLERHGATAEEAIDAQSVMVANFSFEFRTGQMLRLSLADDGAGRHRPVRVGLFDAGAALATVAMSDAGRFVASQDSDGVDDDLEPEEPLLATSSLPTVHDGIWRAALANDVPEPLVRKIIQTVSFDIDLQTHVTPADAVELLYSGTGDDGEIVYAGLRIGGQERRYYRFRASDDGSVDYYDDEGKSSKKFLMRKPTGNARFRSGFGSRRHPILGRTKMHTGVDWAAPRGTPIMAAGSGTITYAKWKGGYGNHIEIRHANGYETTYSHMTGFARGIALGNSVAQGQIIGYIGSTGLSTGPHLHYEVLVNGRFVDPMKIKLPRGRILAGAELAAFEGERKRVDAILDTEEGAQPRLATLR